MTDAMIREPRRGQMLARGATTAMVRDHTPPAIS